MSEERMRILKMIESGQLTAEEGAELLEALEAPSTEAAQRSGDETRSGTETRSGARFLRIRVFDSVTDREKINMAVPIGLAKMLSSLLPDDQRRQLEEHGIRIEDLLRSIESGKVGKVVDIDNKDQEEKVEISIE